MSYQDVQRLL